MQHDTTRRAALTSLAAAGLWGLTACGGGDDNKPGGDTVRVVLEYPKDLINVEWLKPFTIAPLALDTQGHSYTLSLTDDSGQAPSWATINQKTGVITGQAPKDGELWLYVWLHIRNGANPVNTPVRLFSGAGIGFSYSPSGQYAMNKPMSIPLEAKGLKPGDVVKYTPHPNARLPRGVVINMSTGAVEGTPTEMGTFSPWLNITVTRNGMTVPFVANCNSAVIFLGN
ncbi:MAG: putative Ig domain-containing protein [Pseudomonadota bacterium]|nr:putative Ig domain-containing protein [Pseudomonadota bacterium]